MHSSAPLILDVGVVLLAAALAGALARRIGLPAVVGYLGVGLLVSPFTPGYVADRTQIAVLADIGVVLLLFEVGIEIDLGRLRREHGPLLWAAPLQLLLSTAISATVFVAIGVAAGGAAILGLAVALSSSVVVVNITRSRRRTTDPATERALLGWSLLQDIGGIVLAILVLSFAGVGGRSVPIALAGFVVFAAIAAAVALALPRLLRRLRDQHDLFLLTSVSSGLVLAGVGEVAFGIPLALAAFVGGLVLPDRPDTAEARRRLLPFRDLFAVLFFVSIGSLVDPAALQRGAPFFVLLLVLVVVAKCAPAFGLAWIAGLQIHRAQLAVGIGQLGEFGFVLASAGRTVGAVGEDEYAAVLGAVIVSIAVSAVLARLVGRGRVVADGEAQPAAS